MAERELVDQFLHAYPFPIACCYQRLVATRLPAERWERSRYLFEATVKYVACRAIANYLRSSRRDADADAALSCLTRPSMGHWVNLTRHCLRAAGDVDPQLSKALEQPATHGGRLAEAHSQLREYLDPGTKPQRTTNILNFAELMVSYRNRSVGHGAPQASHVEKFAPILEGAVVELLEHLDVLVKNPLLYLAEIRVERQRYVHSFFRLMGTNKIALPEHVTGPADALLGLDRSLVIDLGDGPGRWLSLHPLVIHAADEVFMLQSSDISRGVRYLCHHSDATYEADHVFEDFKERFATFLSGATPLSRGEVSPEATYRSCLDMSLVDGVIGDDEREYLDDLRDRLGLDPALADSLEEQARRARGPVSRTDRHAGPTTTERATPAPTSPPADPTSALDERDVILERCGRAVLTCLRHRDVPSAPMKLNDLHAALVASAPDLFASMPPARLARMIGDLQNHGAAPGLVRSPSGYAVVEDHIAFKVTQGRSQKEEIAATATALVLPGMRIGLDGGSTTLPIARQLAEALDADILMDLTIVTNSLPVMREFADVIQRRGWTDADCPVRVLVPGGRLRAVTHAIAEPVQAAGITADSLQRLLETTEGLDLAFVGGNGVSAQDGITIPTGIERFVKRQLMEAATRGYVVADSTKLGRTFPFPLVAWTEPFGLIMDRPEQPSPALDAILQLERRVEILLAGHAGA